MDNKSEIDNADRYSENHICNNEKYASQMSYNAVKEIRPVRKPVRRS